AREKLRYDPAGREEDRVLLVDGLRGRAVLDRVEARASVFVREAAALEEPRRAGMIRVRARPEDPLLALDPLPADARVVGAAAGREATQLLEDRARPGEGEEVADAEALGDVAHDAPVGPCLAGRLDRLPDPDDTPLDGRRRALVLLVQRAGQHEVGVARGLGEEEVDRDEEVGSLERLAREALVGQRDERVEAEREEAADLAPVQHLHDLRRGRALPRDALLRDAPEPRDVRAVLGVLDVARARELVAALPV